MGYVAIPDVSFHGYSSCLDFPYILNVFNLFLFAANYILQ